MGSRLGSSHISLATMCSSKLFWLLIVFLVPTITILGGVRFYQEKYGESSSSSSLSGMPSELVQKFYLNPDKESLYRVKSIWEHTFSLARYFMMDLFLPKADLVRQQIKNKTEDITERTSSYLKELMDEYKPDLPSMNK